MALQLCNAKAMSSEQHLQQRLLLRKGRGDSRIWRNNVGVGWQGRDALGRAGIKPITRENLNAARAALQPGDIVIRQPRPLHAGLCQYSSDAIGITSVVVTPQMVGERHGLFTAIEVKPPSGRVDRDRMQKQSEYVAQVRRMGGLAGFAKSLEDADEILVGGKGWEPDWLDPLPPQPLLV